MTSSIQKFIARQIIRTFGMAMVGVSVLLIRESVIIFFPLWMTGWIIYDFHKKYE